MNKKIIGIILLGVLLYLPGCGASNLIKSYERENVSLGHIQRVAVLPFEGGGNAQRVREFTMTQILTAGVFDVVDKGLVDSMMTQEAIGQGAPLDAATLKRLGQLLNVQAFILGSVEQGNSSRGSAVFPEVTITMRLIDSETGIVLWQASGRGTGFSFADRLFGLSPKDSFQVTMKLLEGLFKTLH